MKLKVTCSGRGGSKVAYTACQLHCTSSSPIAWHPLAPAIPPPPSPLASNVALGYETPATYGVVPVLTTDVTSTLPRPCALSARTGNQMAVGRHSQRLMPPNRLPIPERALTQRDGVVHAARAQRLLAVLLAVNIAVGAGGVACRATCRRAVARAVALRRGARACRRRQVGRWAGGQVGRWAGGQVGSPNVALQAGYCDPAVVSWPPHAHFAHLHWTYSLSQALLAHSCVLVQ